MATIDNAKLVFDAVVVLGGGVGIDSPSYYRVLKAIEIINNNLAKKLILTGSKEEIVFMKSIAIERVELDKIVECEPSKTTIGNAYYAKLKAIELGLNKLAIVTSYYHIERAKKIFEWILGEEFEIEFYYNTNEPTNKQAEEREKRLMHLVPLLELFEKGDHETIMRVLRFFEIE